LGLREAGFTPVYAANHDPVCIATHSRHFDCPHDVADVSQLQMTGLPGSDFLWASVICTEVSPAGHRRTHREPLAFDAQGRPIGSARFARTRATAFDVLRAVEVHRYKVVCIENVVEFTRWELFAWWLHALRLLGYRVEIVSVSAAHVGDENNLAAPQLRDRIYITCTRLDLPAPDLAPRPKAWCPSCRRHVRGVQTWRPAAVRRQLLVGRYGKSYDYRCPKSSCGSLVEPVARPAVDALDLTDLGQPLAARTTAPRPSTVARLQAAIRYLSTDATRRHPPGTPAQPLERRIAILEYRRHCDAASGLEPLSTVSAQGNHHAIVAAPPGYTPGEKLTIHDLTYRIIKPTEQAASQRFPATYTMSGTGADQTLQAGNAVAVNVARWIGERTRQIL
jgi:DNA (cytosine-5)-methyltransferase 1